MLVPAVCYKAELDEAMSKLFYTIDMFYYTGCVNSWSIEPTNNTGWYQYAIINDTKKLVGYISYYIDYYDSCASKFSLVSFDRDDVYTMSSALKEVTQQILNMNLRRIDYRMVSGNPVQRHYDNMMHHFTRFGYDGQCLKLRDATRDAKGDYHDLLIYELLKTEERG